MFLGSSDYTITSTVGAGGSINPEGSISVTEGGSQTFAISPDDGYLIDDVLVDGISEGPISTYTFTDIIQDHTIQATFIPISSVNRVYNIDTAVDYATIQDAIDAALDDQTIIVYPGTYYENIEFGYQDITVQSTDPLDPAVVAATIIDGQELDSVVKFTGGDTSTLAGFTIQNGNADWNGGGIHVYNSSPTITDNTINDNDAGSYGGGIYLYYSSPAITGNDISENRAGVWGGGIFVSNSSPTITGNDIMSNDAFEGSGGGIYVYSGSPTIGGTGEPYIGPTGPFNTICGNYPDQIVPDSYPYNHIYTDCEDWLDL